MQQIDSLYISENVIFVRSFTSLAHNLCQLFHLRFERWFLFATISGCVSVRKLKEVSKVHWCIIIVFFYTRLPFNWRTPLGYAIALSVQGLAAYFTLVSISTVVCFLVGSCWLFISFIKEVSEDLCVLYDDKSAKRNHADLSKYYSNIIQTYADVKQLSTKIRSLL